MLTMLGACSKNDGELSLSCYGRHIQSQKDSVLTATDETKTYQFKHRTTGNYQCEWSSKIILCSSVEEKDGALVSKQLIYDQANEAFTETTSTEQLAKNTSVKPTRVNTFFIGRCSKPIMGMQ
jgi:hypothetical protein